MTAILILSNLIIDDIVFADGRTMPGQLGGAGVYAATGAAFWWQNIALVCGVGRDLEELTEGRVEKLRLRSEGLLERHPHTIRSTLTYRKDGSRTEIPRHGADHFASLDVTAAEIPACFRPAAATYVFRGAERPYWDAIDAARPDLGVIFWEVAVHPEHPPQAADIVARCGTVDMVSINVEEARLIFRDDPEIAVARLLAEGAAIVVLRMGASGSIVASRSSSFVITPSAGPVLDVTGAGNAFCGGFLAGWTMRPGDLAHAARCASASAARTIRQHGPADPNDRDDIDVLAMSCQIRDHPLRSAAR